MTTRLAARVDAILAGRTPAPARSLTFPINCRDCLRNRRATPGFDIVAAEHTEISRVTAECVRCGRRYTYTVTCVAQGAHLSRVGAA